MSDPRLPRDTGSAAIQAVFPVATTTLSVSAPTARIAMPPNTNVVRIASNVDVYLEFGGSGVNATSSSMLFPAGAEVFSCVDDNVTHVAAMLVGATPGVLTASKMV